MSGKARPGGLAALLVVLSVPGFPGTGHFRISRIYDQNLAVRFNADGKDGRSVYLEPEWVAPAADGSAYAGLRAFGRIVRIGADGIVRTAVGGGGLEAADGVSALQVKLPETFYGAAAPSGQLYFTAGRRIFRIESNGTLKLVAGNGEPGFSGDGGPAIAAAIDRPSYPVIDPKGVLYFYSTMRIRAVDAQGNIRTLAGNGEWGFAEGPAASVPVAVYGLSMGVDGAGNVYWLCGWNFVKLDRATSTVSVIGAGSWTGAGPQEGADAHQLGPLNVLGITATPEGDVCTADRRFLTVYCITPAGKVRVVAGNGSFGWQPQGPAREIPLILPGLVTAAADGTLWLVDHTTVRKVAHESLEWVAGVFAGAGLGEDGPLAASLLHNLQGLAWNSAGELHVSETATHSVWKIDGQGRLRRVAGNGMPGSAGDDGPAIRASLREPYGICFDPWDNLYITSPGILRKVSRGGTITTAAKGAMNETMGSTHCAVDRNGNVYFTLSSRSSVVYRLDSFGARTAAGTPMKWGFEGDNGPAGAALLDGPRGMAMDRQGNVYFADYNNARVRRIAPDGVISTVAGNGEKGTGGDGGPAQQAQLGGVHDVAVDANDNLYVLDAEHGRVRRIDTSGNISLAAGGGSGEFRGDEEATSVLLGTSGRIYDASYYLEAGPQGRMAGIDDAGIFALDSARIFANWVYNAASFQAGPIAPGEIVTFYGEGIGPKQLLTGSYAEGRLPGELAGTRFLFDGVAAPLVYVSETQSSVVVPYGVGGSTTVEVEFAGQRTNRIQLPVAAAAPGIFSYSGGTGQIVAVNLNPDGSGGLNEAARPVRRGGWLTLFATGQGRVTPGVADGQQLAGPEFPAPQLPVAVSIGDSAVAGGDLWAGLVYQGVLQVNVRIPESAPAGDAVPIRLRIGEAASPEGTTIAVR